jgi:hypothetical protein
MKTDQLMMCREIIAVCSEMHKKHINTLCGRNVEYFCVKPDIFMSLNPLCCYKATSHQPNTTIFFKFCSIADLLVYVKSDGTLRNNWALRDFRLPPLCQ